MALFWTVMLLGTVNAAVLAIGLWRRSVRRWTAVLSCIAIGSTAASGVWLWRIEGVCLLPHRDAVAFRPGTTLCPDQSMRIEITVPNPARGRDL
jgi:hypothetical protein